MRQRPVIADLFCGAGGAAMGLFYAGFRVVGFDVKPQPNYPFEFHEQDALTVDLSRFDAVWASPPCQAYTAMQHIRKNGKAHSDMLEPTRNRLMESGLPYVIENVPGAPIKAGLLLCGTMFGLNIIKHRYFEANVPLPLAPATCNHHRGIYDPWHGLGRTQAKHQEAQGTPWIPTGGGRSRGAGITGDLNNAIPPAYSRFLGEQLIKYVRTGPHGPQPKEGTDAIVG